jgi:pantetheine-phosphate adenylyltransferase
MQNKIIYPGTFDPITNGHVNIIERATRIFPYVVVAVASSNKKNLFTLEERVQLVRKVVAKYKNVSVCTFSGLLVDLARERKSMLILRGLRAISDYEFELQLANLNRSMEPKIETIFLTPTEKYAYISSSMLREIATLGGNTSQFVPTVVQKALQKKIKS